MTAGDKRDWQIPDSHVFDLSHSRQGYNLNKLSLALTDPASRAAFIADEDSFMARFGLSDAQKQAIKARDWLRCIELGGNIYLVMKIGSTLGEGLYKVGAQQRGETLDEFLATRNVKGAV